MTPFETEIASVVDTILQDYQSQREIDRLERDCEPAAGGKRLFAIGFAALLLTLLFTMLSADAGLILLTLREDPVNGARRWLHFGSKISFQPSEAAKILLILFFSQFIIMYRKKMNQITGYILRVI